MLFATVAVCVGLIVTIGCAGIANTLGVGSPRPYAYCNDGSYTFDCGYGCTNNGGIREGCECGSPATEEWPPPIPPWMQNN